MRLLSVDEIQTGEILFNSLLDDIIYIWRVSQAADHWIHYSQEMPVSR